MAVLTIEMKIVVNTEILSQYDNINKKNTQHKDFWLGFIANQPL